MQTKLRSLLVCGLALLVGMMPAAAFAAPYAALTWERHIGTTGTGAGQLIGPTDVAVDKMGNVYVAGGTSGDNRVQMFSSTGSFIKSVGTVAPSATWMSNPQCIAVDRWGNVYVGEAGNGGRVHYFGAGLDSADHRTWDGTEAYNRITNPRSISVSLGGRVYIADETEGNLQWWTPYGNFMETTLPHGLPTRGLAFSQDGFVYTTTGTDSGTKESVVVYDPWGSVVSWGGHGSANGLFNEPYDVGVDPLDMSYTVERLGGRGQVFDGAGGFLTKFGSTGAGNGQFFEPEGIAVGLDRTTYVADTGNDRVSKWKVSTPAVVAEVAGANRILTAVQTSQRAFPKGASTVIITTGYNWPDALGGAALAGRVGGPILLTAKDTLPSAVLDEIQRIKPGKAYVLGSEDAVGAAVFDAVRAAVATHDVERIGGVDRYETANKIAYKVKQLVGPDYDGTAFVCTGTNFPDALAAAPIAAANGWPIYLTPPAGLLASVRAALLQTAGGNPSHHGYIIGSEAAVGASVKTELDAPPFFGFDRIGGADRYATAAYLATLGFDGMGMLWSRPAIATGENFPDALAGSVLQGSGCSVMLLTRKGSLPAVADAAIAANKDRIYEVRFFGDTNAIGAAVRNQVRTTLGLPW